MSESMRGERQEQPQLDQQVDRLLDKHFSDPQSPRPEEVRRLVGELEQRCGELEVQNRELLQARQQLQAYRDRYVDLYDSAPLGYVTFDEDGYVQEINLAGAQMLGRQREELTGYAFADHVAEGQRESFRQQVRACCGQGRAVTSESGLVARDGRVIAVQLHMVPIEAPEREGAFCKTAVADITARKQAEDALCQSREGLRLVLEASRTGWWRLDLANGKLAADERCLSLFGLPTDTPPSFPLFLERIWPEDRELAQRHVNESLARPGDYEGEYRTTWPDGGRHWIFIRGRAIHDDDGKPLCMVGVVMDVTERKQVEEALQQERNLLRTLIDNLPDHVYVKDAQGRFVAANLVAARIMGAVTPGDLIGKTDADFYTAELAAEYRQDEEQLARTGEPLVNKEEPHLDTAGNRRAVLTTKVPLKDSQGRVVGLVGISRDVTDRARIEEELRLLNRTLEERVAQRTAEVQRRTAERQALACELIQAEDRQRRRLAQVLHDNLQQLLVAARMKVGRLGKRTADQTLREQLKDVEQILAESIGESRSLTLELSPPVLNEAGLAGGLQWLAQQMEDKHGLCVGVEIDPAAEPGDEVSRVFLFQAVRELLFNVVKHAQAASARVRLTRGEGATIRVDVGDDGVGADPARQAWGFGLASVHQRVEILGGHLEMEASPGRGTEVSIFVPQRQAAAPSHGQLPV